MSAATIRWNDGADLLSLYCDTCDEVMCDVEDGDGLDVLAGVARDHFCGVNP